MKNKELMMKSLNGLWVGDCMGNIGQMYFIHDILNVLGDKSVILNGHLKYSDDTEESIVLVNHLNKNNKIKQDELAMELATRFFEGDPEGIVFGYGLNTRTVLTDIYQGKPWKEANKISLNNSTQKVGSCGNGSVMRLPPLGAYFNDKSIDFVIEQCILQAEVTHCHQEGIAGAIAIGLLSKCITTCMIWKDISNGDVMLFHYYDLLLDNTPKGEVWNGIKKASELDLDTPLNNVIEILGNGKHVTCQDTVPLCVFLTIKSLIKYKIEEMYEKSIIETSMCFGDVDTNCAIVGGMLGIVSPIPEKWINYCKPMEDVI